MPRKSARQIELEAENARLRAQLEARPAVAAPLIGGMEHRPKSAGTVTVACKIPMGMRLQLQKPMERLVPTGRGGHDDFERVTFNTFYGQPRYVFGPATPAQALSGYIMPPAIEGGAALTHGIEADFWEQWLEQNKNAEYVVNGMIYALDAASARDKSRDEAERTSGLEPLSQDVDSKGRLTDRRVPKPMNASVARVGYDADRSAERASQSQ